MIYVLIGASCLIGMVLSYGLNRVLTARIIARRTGMPLARRTSLAIVVGLWADGFVLVASLITFSSHWLFVLVPWILLNYGVAMLVAARGQLVKER